MKKPSAFVLVALSVGLFAAVINIANAATPTPTPTAVPTAVPTPAPNQVSTFRGSCWLNAQLCRGAMTAKVGDTVCAVDSTPITPASSINRTLFTLKVPSTDVLPGCGSEGAQVAFFVGDQRITQTGVWHAGTLQSMYFTAGYPFARFRGTLTGYQDRSDRKLVPSVGAASCGFGYVGPGGYEADVLSASQQPGCGTEGAQVTFKILDAQGNVVAVANETGTWHAWDGINEPPPLNLTFGAGGGSGAGLPNTGTRDGFGEGLLWATLALLLGTLGFVATAFGLVLRRRTPTH